MRTYVLGHCVGCESKELQDICVDTMMCRECLGITQMIAHCDYCAVCRGAGELPLLTSDGGTIELKSWKTCSHCAGTGKVAAA
jgi:DnaJ-class molecular chaperone